MESYCRFPPGWIFVRFSGEPGRVRHPRPPRRVPSFPIFAVCLCRFFFLDGPLCLHWSPLNLHSSLLTNRSWLLKGAEAAVSPGPPWA